MNIRTTIRASRLKVWQKALFWVPLFFLILATPAQAQDTPDLSLLSPHPFDRFLTLFPTPPPVPEKKSLDLPIDDRAWTESPYQIIIEATAERYRLDPQVIYATIMTESHGDRFAFRFEPNLNDASLGLGQILVSTARGLGFAGDPYELYKPEVNIDLIGKYHREMLDTYGPLTPLELATAYNAGSPWHSPVPGHLERFQHWFDEKNTGFTGSLGF